MKIPPLIAVMALSAISIPSTLANIVTWNGNTSGNWSDSANWLSSPNYPGSGLVADQTVAFRGDGSGTNAIELDVDVIIGGLSMVPSASRAYNVQSTTGKTITLQHSTNIAEMNFTGGGGGTVDRRTLGVGFKLDVDTVNLQGRLANLTGNLTAINGRSVTLNVTANFAGAGVNDIIVLAGTNSFGANGIITIAGNSALEFQNANASGGANTSIQFNSKTTNSALNLNTAGGNVQYKSSVAVAEDVIGKIYLKQNGGTNGANASSVGSMTVGKNGTLLLTGNNHGYLSTSGTVMIHSGGVLVARGDRANAASSLAFSLKSDAILSGAGTIATAIVAGATPSVNKAIILESGALLAPGDPGVPGSTAILSIGNAADYADSQLTLNSGARIRFDLNGLTAGDDHDQIHVAGNSIFSITGAVLEFNLLSSYASSAEVMLIRFDSNATRVGEFAGLANGAMVTLSSEVTARIYYNGGDGNDIVLREFAAIPEPRIVTILGMGLGCLILFYRRSIKA